MYFSGRHESTYNLTTRTTCASRPPIADPLITAEAEIFLSLYNEMHFSGRNESTYNLTTRTTCTSRPPIADPLITAEVEIFLSP